MLSLAIRQCWLRQHLLPVPHTQLVPLVLNSTACTACTAHVLLQEYCDLGSLGTVALKWQGTGDADQHMLERLSLLSDAARGLREVHGLGLAHGDLVSWHNPPQS